MTAASTAKAVVSAATSSDRAWRALVDAASAPYCNAGRYAWHFARGKLGGDPVFRHLLERGLVAPHARVVDIGCGQGLLASLLHAAGSASHASHWPAGWAAAPVGVHVTGIELMRRDVERGETALGAAATFVCADMRNAELPRADAVVIFDALHYIDPTEQDRLLLRVRAALRGGGVLLLRVADAGSRGGFAFGRWVDRAVMFMRGGGWMRLTGRPLDDWTRHLTQLGFAVEVEPMSGRLPLANVLLVASIAAEAPR